jgi:diaminopimelate decarboxylase
MRVSEASDKLRATTPARRSRQPYRPPARGVIPPPSPDLYSKIAKMQGIESSGMSAHRASETVTLDPSDAAREIVELLRAWGVEI